MKKIVVAIPIFLIIQLSIFSQSLSDTQMRNARATGYAIVAARNPGIDFTIYVIPWDGINTLEYNANTQINSGWHAQAAVKGNYFSHAFDGTDFSSYSSVVVSQASFDLYKNTGTEWWIVCSTLPPFSENITNLKISGSLAVGATNPYTRAEVASPGLGYWNSVDGWAGQTPPSSTLTISNTYTGGYDPVLLFRQTDQGGLIKQSGAIGLVGRSSWNSGDNSSQISDMYFAVRNASGGISERMRIDFNGNVGIGTVNPSRKLEVRSEILINNPGWRGSSFLSLQRGPEGMDNATITFGQGGIVAWNAGLLYDGGNLSPNYYISQSGVIREGSGNLPHQPEFTITSSGNVGIGIFNPAYKLDVTGTIRANEIIVNTTGADFVFAPYYNLPNLSEIEKFIKINKHLPEIPSAKEMQENGISVSEIQIKLLQKIEELTLYSIEQNKRIELLEKEIEKLNKR